MPIRFVGQVFGLCLLTLILVDIFVTAVYTALLAIPSRSISIRGLVKPATRRFTDERGEFLNAHCPDASGLRFFNQQSKFSIQHFQRQLLERIAHAPSTP